MDNTEVNKLQNVELDEILLDMNDFLSSSEGSAFNICAKLYEMIIRGKKEDQPRLFQQAIFLYEDVIPNKTTTAPVSQYEIQKATLKEQYGNLVNSFIEFFVQQKYLFFYLFSTFLFKFFIFLSFFYYFSDKNFSFIFLA